MRYAISFLAGLAVAWLGIPLWREAVMRVFEGRYQELTYRCDSAMREHFIAQARLGETADSSTAQEVVAAEIALIDCQDYDLLQKRLNQLGLRDNELSLMRLRAIEGRNGRLDEVVRIHEIRD